jgi:hypothetical protein
MMHHGGTARRWVRTLMPFLLLSLIAVSDGIAEEWEKLRQSYDNALRAHAKRIAEIEARERGGPVDQEKRADKITRDRITGIKGALKAGGKARSLANSAERAPREARALLDVSREHGEYLDIVISEWQAEGTERRTLREAAVTLPKNLEHANASLTRAIEVAEAATRLVPESGLPATVGRIEAAEKERARWLREQAALDRERQQRERGAAERERGLR